MGELFHIIFHILRGMIRSLLYFLRLYRVRPGQIYISDLDVRHLHKHRFIDIELIEILEHKRPVVKTKCKFINHDGSNFECEIDMDTYLLLYLNKRLYR